MNTKFFVRAFVLIGGLFLLQSTLQGCKPKPPTISAATVEEQRKTVRDNVSLQVTKYRGENGLGELEINQRGDSTISPECPQGDGWASVDLVEHGTRKVIQELKCSTFSEGIGCMTSADFKTKRYASQDNNCNSEVPFPIPHIAK